MPTSVDSTYNVVVQGYDYFNYVKGGWTVQSMAYGTAYGPSQSPGYEVIAPPVETPAVEAPSAKKAGK